MKNNFHAFLRLKRLKLLDWRSPTQLKQGVNEREKRFVNSPREFCSHAALWLFPHCIVPLFHPQRKVPERHSFSAWLVSNRIPAAS